MIDRTLMATILEVLSEQQALSCGTEEQALFNDINLRATVPVTTPLLREHLTLADDKGWADWNLDSLRYRRWRLTPAGKGQLSDMRSGG